MLDDREIRCRHCDARQSLGGYCDALFYVEVGDGAPYFELELDGDPIMSCDICGRTGEWHDMGYIYYPGITDGEKEAQRDV